MAITGDRAGGRDGDTSGDTWSVHVLIKGEPRNLGRNSTRRDGRVVDGGGLENHCTRKGTGGSNPSPSANLAPRSARIRPPAPARAFKMCRDAARHAITRDFLIVLTRHVLKSAGECAASTRPARVVDAAHTAIGSLNGLGSCGRNSRSCENSRSPGLRPPIDLLPQQCRHWSALHPATRFVRNIVSSHLSDRSSWRTRYVSPSAPLSLKYL
jgi:hypothetical protein